MKKSNYTLILVAIALCVNVAVERATTTKPVELTHAQVTWIGALEWCESHARHTAVNKVDRDGTPSYYSFQFKPSTFKYFGETYGVIPKGLNEQGVFEKMQDYEIMRTVVEKMVIDRKNIKWQNQFPDCVKRLGVPPNY